MGVLFRKKTYNWVRNGFFWSCWFDFGSENVIGRAKCTCKEYNRKKTKLRLLPKKLKSKILRCAFATAIKMLCNSSRVESFVVRMWIESLPRSRRCHRLLQVSKDSGSPGGLWISAVAGSWNCGWRHIEWNRWIARANTILAALCSCVACFFSIVNDFVSTVCALLVE